MGFDGNDLLREDPEVAKSFGDDEAAEKTYVYGPPARVYTAEEVAAHFKREKGRVEPLILRRENDRAAMIAGAPRIEPVCSKCGGTFYGGQLDYRRLQGLSDMGLPDDERFYCRKCRTAKEGTYVPPNVDIQEVVAAYRERYGS